MRSAQDGAKPGPRFAPLLRELGWEAESWVKWEKERSPVGTAQVLTQTLKAVPFNQPAQS